MARGDVTYHLEKYKRDESFKGEEQFSYARICEEKKELSEAAPEGEIYLIKKTEES